MQRVTYPALLCMERHRSICLSAYLMEQGWVFPWRVGPLTPLCYQAPLYALGKGT